MKNSLHLICDRLCERKKYVNSQTILLMDIFLSAGSSFVTLLFADNFIIDLSRLTYALVMLGACVTSFLAFWGLRVNRNIIRHATIKSIGRMGVAVLLKEILLRFRARLVDGHRDRIRARRHGERLRNRIRDRKSVV